MATADNQASSEFLRGAVRRNCARLSGHGYYEDKPQHTVAVLKAERPLAAPVAVYE